MEALKRRALKTEKNNKFRSAINLSCPKYLFDSEHKGLYFKENLIGEIGNNSDVRKSGKSK